MSCRVLEADIDAAFDLYDTDGSGRITQEELQFALKGLGFPNVTKADVLQIFKHVDKENTGTIDKPSFRTLVRDKLKTADGPEEVLAAFKMFDINSAGKISFSNLYDIAARIYPNETPNEDLLRDVIKVADRDGDGEIGWEDWKYAMSWANRRHGDINTVNRWNHFGITILPTISPAAKNAPARRKSASATQGGAGSTTNESEKVSSIINSAKTYEPVKSITIHGTTVAVEADGKITKNSAWTAIQAVSPVGRSDFDLLFEGEDTDNDGKVTLTQYKGLLTALGEGD